jgi:pilus assembly protein CpaD
MASVSIDRVPENPPMSSFRPVIAALMRTAACVGVTLTLAGCYASTQEAKLAPPADYRDRHPITLQQGERTVELFISRNRGGLSPDQRADALAFARSWQREASGGIIVDVPSDPTLKRSVGDSLREIHSIFAQSGVPRSGVRVTQYAKRDQELPAIRLRYPKLTAQAGPCGLWPEDTGPSFGRTYTENRQFYNMGCAHQRNLAAMVENPADLIQPRAEAPAYTARRSVALDKYRKGESPAGTYERYEQGKISDLGK